MTNEDDARSPVQDTASKNIRNYVEEPPLSIEETPLKSKISAEKCKWQNVDNRAVEDSGPVRKPSTLNGQGFMDFLCNSPNSNASEDKRKTFDDTSVEDKVSTAFQQDGNTTTSCALEKMAPEGRSLNKITTQFSETEDNAEVGYRPKDEKRTIPGVSTTGQNVFNVKTADSNNIYEDTTITGGQLQGGGDMQNKIAIDLENETSSDHGKDNNDSLCHRSNIKETDVKEEKSDGTLPMANASEGLQQDVTKDIRLDGHGTMTLKSEDSTTEVPEKKMLTRLGNRSNDSTSNHSESGPNVDVGCRPSDDVLAHHEGNIRSSLVCQTGRHASSDCIGCNQSTNILKIDVGTSTDPYDTGRKSKKRRKKKCRVDTLSIDSNPEDNIGPNSQNQVPVIKKNPNALAATSNSSFQQDSNVSVITKPAHHTSSLCASEIHISSGSQVMGKGPSRARKPMSGSTVLKNAANIFLMIFRGFEILVVLIIVASMMAQASPVQKQWQQFQFCRKDGPLNDQVLNIRNMEDRGSEDCTLNFTSVPFFKNCSESRSLVFVENTTCVDMMTEDLSTEHWRMEYGSNEGIPAARGGRVNEKSVLEKLAEYTKTADGSTQRLSAEDNTHTDDSRWQQFWFHMTNGSLMNQSLTIRDMNDRSSKGCSFIVTAVPFFKNCSHLGFLVFVGNETSAEILTKGRTTGDWIMECGLTRNGHDLSAARGGRLNETSVKDKIAEYMKTADSSAQRPPAEDDPHTADSHRQKLWQQFWFHMMNGSLMNQLLTIRDMNDRRSEGCSFIVPAVPFFHNCSHLGFLVFMENETSAEILTDGRTTGDWIMECGRSRNGHDLSAARGETLDEKSLLEKITKCMKPADGSAQGWSAEDIVEIAAGIGAPLLLLLALFLLYGLCRKFRRWVNDVVCRRGRRNTNNGPQTGANLESNTNGIPLLQITSTNGTANGGLQNGEIQSVGLLETDQMETDTTTHAEDSL